MNMTIASARSSRTRCLPARTAGRTEKIDTSGHTKNSISLARRSPSAASSLRGRWPRTTSTRIRPLDAWFPPSVTTTRFHSALRRSSSLPAGIAVGVLSGANDGDRQRSVEVPPGLTARGLADDHRDGRELPEAPPDSLGPYSPFCQRNTSAPAKLGASTGRSSSAEDALHHVRQSGREVRPVVRPEAVSWPSGQARGDGAASPHRVEMTSRPPGATSFAAWRRALQGLQVSITSTSRTCPRPAARRLLSWQRTEADVVLQVGVQPVDRVDTHRLRLPPVPDRAQQVSAPQPRSSQRSPGAGREAARAPSTIACIEAPADAIWSE